MYVSFWFKRTLPFPVLFLAAAAVTTTHNVTTSAAPPPPRCTRRRRRRATGANRTFKAGRTTDLRADGRVVDHSTPPKNFWPPFLSRPSLGRPESKAKRARHFSSSPPAASLLEQMNRRGSAPPTIYVYRDRLKSCTTKATKGRKFSHSGKSLFAKPTNKHIFSLSVTLLS